MVAKTAKSLNREKYVLEKLNKQIEQLREKEDYLKNELMIVSENLQDSKLKENEIKQLNHRAKLHAEEEIKRNQQEHNELKMLRDLKKTTQKELNRAVQDNLNAKYNLDSLKETKKVLEHNFRNLQENNQNLSQEKEELNEELLQYKQEYDELMQLYELKRAEDNQLKTLYKFHFN